MLDIAGKKSFAKYESKDFIKFTKKDEIDFLKRADWIIDYNLYITKSIDEIITEIKNVDLEGKKINEYYNNISEKQKELEHSYLLVKAKMLRYKRETLEDILRLKQNKKTIDLKENSLFQKILQKVKK